ncbi:MAG: peptidyl-prolyl cis-trans isomerase [bacterium]|nr:peptidyl-prolyl cis-trans isomerase [bacterium]
MTAGPVRWLVVSAALLWASACQVGNVPAAKGNHVVILTTSKGAIEIELDAKNAPISSENFLAYVDSGHFDGTIFHRVIPGFMVQGGGFTADMNQKGTRAPIENEATNGLKNERGTLSMARTSDPNSATAQFFINVADNGFLDHTSPDPRGYGYAVFAKVTSGMDVVDAIVGVPTGNHGGHGDVPNEAITIESAKRK